MEKFIAYTCITAIAILCYGLFWIFYTLETKKTACLEKYDEIQCLPWSHDSN